MDKKRKKTFLKDEESGLGDLKDLIRKNKNQNKILQKLLNNINKSNKSNIEGNA